MKRKEEKPGGIPGGLLVLFHCTSLSHCLSMFGPVCQGVWASLSGCLGQFVRVFGPVCQGVWASLSGCLGQFVRVFGPVCQGVWASLSGCLGQFVRVFGPVCQGVWASLSGCLGQFVRVFGPVCQGDALHCDKIIAGGAINTSSFSTVVNNQYKQVDTWLSPLHTN